MSKVDLSGRRIRRHATFPSAVHLVTGDTRARIVPVRVVAYLIAETPLFALIAIWQTRQQSLEKRNSKCKSKLGQEPTYYQKINAWMNPETFRR